MGSHGPTEPAPAARTGAAPIPARRRWLPGRSRRATKPAVWTPRPPAPLRLASALAALLVVALVLATFAAVALGADSAPRLSPADWRAVRFTLLQATLSALLSCLLAVPVARALSRRRFAGRRALIALLGVPFLLPVIVAAFGLLGLFGRAGLVNQGLALLGLPPVSIYGLQGVLIAHVFFNLPLATRLILQGWAEVPAETFRLAAALGLPDRQLLRLVERPILRATLPGAFVAVFLLCLTSFAVVLILGGGPRATTVELAIYEAFRLQFDLSRAALLALLQVGLGLGAAALALMVSQPREGPGLAAAPRRWDGRGWRRGADGLLLALATAFVSAPVALVVLHGVLAFAEFPSGLLAPALRSLAVALAATALVAAFALPMALRIGAARASAGGRLAELAGTMVIAASPLVLGTGLFLLLNPVADPVALALPLTALVNALMALPIALRSLIPAATEAQARSGRLAESLNLPWRSRLRHVLLPALRAPLGFALGISAALSVGDLGVITLFSDPAQATLPLAMFGLMGSYRSQAANAAALLLVALAFGLFLLFDRRPGRAAA